MKNLLYFNEFNSYIKDKLNILIPKHIPDMYEIWKYLLYL